MNNESNQVIAGICLAGKLEFVVMDEGNGLADTWYVTNWEGKRRNLNEWLDKLEGQNVQITIEVIGTKDANELLGRI